MRGTYWLFLVKNTMARHMDSPEDPTEASFAAIK